MLNILLCLWAVHFNHVLSGGLVFSDLPVLKITVAAVVYTFPQKTWQPREEKKAKTVTVIAAERR